MKVDRDTNYYDILTTIVTMTVKMIIVISVIKKVMMLEAASYVKDKIYELKIK